MDKWYVFAISPVGKVYVARDGGITPDLAEADLVTEDVADDLSVLATQEFEMTFGIEQPTWEDRCSALME